MKKKSVSIYTLGCRTNQSESASIQKTFEDLGYTVVDVKDPADFCVINTCTVTQKGDADCRRMVNKLCRINPKVQIALIGCQAQIQKNELLKLPNVKWVVGTAKKMAIAALMERPGFEPEVPALVVPKIPKSSFTIPSQSIHTGQTRANLKIQEGCNFFCSYCDVPYARGNPRSRLFSDILKEAGSLASAGFKEIVLTGINIGLYSHKGKTLLDAVKSLEKIDGLQRIRLSSVEFQTISSELIEHMAGSDKLCRYLHVPVQNANDKILKLMNRKYTFSYFQKFVKKVLKTIPDVCLGTDLITGFPGETEEDFQLGKQRMEELPIHYFHVFSYSDRNEAKSKNFPNHVPQREITERSRLLRLLSQRKRTAFLKNMLGKEQTVLFEQKKHGTWSGLTDNYIRVKVKSRKNLANTLKKVRALRIDHQMIEGVLSETQS